MTPGAPGRHDHARAASVLSALGAEWLDRIELTITGQPPAKTRPRFGRGRTYSADTAAEEATAWQLRKAFPKPLTETVALVALFYRSTLHRADVDNLIKHLMDAGNGVAWVDDSQIIAVAGSVELDRVSPRTVLAVAPCSVAELDRRIPGVPA